MSKQKQLTKKLVRLGIITAVILALLGGVYFAAMTFAEDATKQKTDAEAAYSTDNTLLGDLRRQMDTSGEAEKRYAGIEAEHPNKRFDVSMEEPNGLNEFLRAAKDRYHFGRLTLKQVKEVKSDKTALANFSHDIMLRPRLTIQILATSDVHIFSFIEDLRRNGPGLIRIDKLELKRTADMTDDAITAMADGTTPLLVDAKIEFTWIRLMSKTNKDNKAGDAATSAAAAPAAGVPAATP